MHAGVVVSDPVPRRGCGRSIFAAGLLVDLLPVLLSYGAASGDNTTVEYYQVPPTGGQLEANGSWSGARSGLHNTVYL